MRDHEADIEGAGAAVAAVGLGDTFYARTFREKSGIGFPLLIDERRRAYRAAGLRSGSLLHVLRSDYKPLKDRAAAAGHRQGRMGKDPFQLGAAFVFAPGDADLHAHVNETFGDNAPVDELIAAAAAWRERR